MPDLLDDDVIVPPEDLLRALPLAEIESDEEILPSIAPSIGGEDRPGAGALSATATFTISPGGEPQEQGTRIHATDSRTGQEFYVGRIVKYGQTRRGLSRRSDTVMYDRHKYADKFGAWAHFIWPTAMAESAGQEIVINAWDRAHFTWGFYQLAAHTPDDNLIVLLRRLVKLPAAKTFFPDLGLDGDGRLTRKTASGQVVSLEDTTTVPVGNGTETQIVDFMEYLNPSSKRFDEKEAVTAARFIAWASEDPEMLATTLSVSIDIMKGKIRRWANTLDLFGKRPELAIWVSDIVHHGRGTRAMLENALAEQTFSSRLNALFKIDKTGEFEERRKTVREAVNKLIDEERFKDVAFGSAPLNL